MHYQKKKSVLFSMLVLMMIITTAITPTLRAQAFSETESTETVAATEQNPDSTGGEGIEPTADQTPQQAWSAPTEIPQETSSDNPTPTPNTTPTPEPTAEMTEDLGEKCAGDKEYGGDDDNKCGFDEKPTVEETDDDPQEGNNPESSPTEDPGNEDDQQPTEEPTETTTEAPSSDTRSGTLQTTLTTIAPEITGSLADDLILEIIAISANTSCAFINYKIRVINQANGTKNNLPNAVISVINGNPVTGKYAHSIQIPKINGNSSWTSAEFSIPANWAADPAENSVSIRAIIDLSQGNTTATISDSASASRPENCTPSTPDPQPDLAISVTQKLSASLPASGCESVQFDVMITNSGDAVGSINETVQLVPGSGSIDPAADASLTFTAIDTPQTITVANPWADPATTEVTLSATFIGDSSAYTAAIQKDEVCTALIAAPDLSVEISINSSESSCVQMVFDVTVTNSSTASGNATVEVIQTASPGTVLETLSFSNVGVSGGTTTRQIALTGPWSQYSFPVTLRATIPNPSGTAPFDEITAGEPDACPSQGNPGAIWTTTYGCDSVQNENHYVVGETVYIRGSNFDPGFYAWTITGQPGGASGDPNTVVASSGSTPYVVHDSNEFCFAAYTIQSDDWGEYTVDFGTKNDNYQVREQASVDVNLACIPSDTYGSLTQVSISAPNNQVKNLSWSYTGDTHATNPIILRGSGTLTLTWDGKGSYDGGSLEIPIIGCEGKESVEPPTIAATCAFEESEFLHTWTVTNNDPDNAIDFSWSSDSGESAASTITLGAGSAISFNTGDEAQTVTVYYNLSGETITPLLSVSKESSACVYSPLSLQQVCLENGDHQWTVTNNNPQDINFDWVSTTDSKVGTNVAVKANGGTASFTTNGQHPQTVTLTYPYAGQTGIQVSETTTESCQIALDLKFVCGYPSDTNLYWEITNQVSKEIELNWETVPSGEKGSLKILGDSGKNTTRIATPLNTQALILFVNGVEVTRAEAGDTCMVDLQLTYECLDSGTQRWTLTNHNSFELNYNRYLDGAAFGTRTIKANSSRTFITPNGAHTIKVDYLHEPYGTKQVSAQAEMCTVERPPSTITNQLVPSTDAAITGSVCPQWILFHSLRDGNLEIYRLDGVEGVNNFELINLSNHNAKDSNPSRSFDDQWVAFQSDRDDNSEIYLTDSMGQSQVRLTDNPAEDINPMFAPDNVNIVFQSNRNGSWDLYRVNRITQQEVQLTDHEADETNPFFAASKNLLVYESNRNGNQDVFLLNLETGDEAQITHQEYDEIHPALSPDGQQIAYLAPVDGVWQLFVSNAEGEDVRQVTDGDSDTTNHAWSPDGTRLAYQSMREGNLDIYSFDLRDNTEYRVTNNPGDDSAPTWDCSSNFIAYTSDNTETSSSDIYRVSWKGGSTSFLTNHPAADKWSQWSPAKEIASRDQ